MTTATVLSSLPKAIVAAAATYQSDTRALVNEAGISAALLDTPGARIPDAAIRRLWARAVAATGDPCLGLVAAQHHVATSFHALGFAWLASRSLGDMLTRLVRYEKVLLNINWAVLEQAEGRTALRLVHRCDEEPAASCRTDNAFATLVYWSRHLAREEVAPAAVEFRHGDHAQRSRYEKMFKSPLTFGAAVDRLWLEGDLLARPLPGRSAALAAEADRIADAYLVGLTDEPTTRRVRELLVDLLPQGEVALEAAAQRLFMSARSLQRHLREEGHNFRSLLDETRRTLAMEYVRDGGHSLAEVAFRLGFSDQSAFTKAFKRWTGSSPASYAANPA